MEMSTLKRDIGLILIKDFINRDEEANIIGAFNSSVPPPAAGARRRVSQHFGYHFDYTTFGASTTVYTPPPEHITDLLPRLPIRDNVPDQFTIQYYPPGAGIPPHVDTHSLFGEEIYSLSLGSTVPMQFRKCSAKDARRMRLPKRSAEAISESSEPCQAHSSLEVVEDDMMDEDDSFEIFLPPRSLLVMTGPSRYGYVHGIRGRKTDQVGVESVPRTGRYSITMRSINRGLQIGCSCEYPRVCDARIAEESIQRDQHRKS
jgi:alkylated DNA repair protein alkB family protein 8